MTSRARKIRDIVIFDLAILAALGGVAWIRPDDWPILTYVATFTLAISSVPITNLMREREAENGSVSAVSPPITADEVVAHLGPARILGMRPGLFFLIAGAVGALLVLFS